MSNDNTRNLRSKVVGYCPPRELASSEIWSERFELGRQCGITNAIMSKMVSFLKENCPNIENTAKKIWLHWSLFGFQKLEKFEKKSRWLQLLISLDPLVVLWECFSDFLYLPMRCTSSTNVLTMPWSRIEIVVNERPCKMCIIAQWSENSVFIRHPRL